MNVVNLFPENWFHNNISALFAMIAIVFSLEFPLLSYEPIYSIVILLTYFTVPIKFCNKIYKKYIFIFVINWKLCSNIAIFLILNMLCLYTRMYSQNWKLEHINAQHVCFHLLQVTCEWEMFDNACKGRKYICMFIASTHKKKQKYLPHITEGNGKSLS